MVASTSIIGDWVTAVAGERVKLRVLAPPGSDLHSFEPMPGDIRALGSADVLFEFGLGLETWLQDMLRVAQNAPQRVVLSDGLPLLRPGEAYWRHWPSAAAETGHEISPIAAASQVASTAWKTLVAALPSGETPCDAPHAHANHRHSKACPVGEYDPHVWFDALNAQTMVARIARVLADTNPTNAAYYEQRARAYIDELQELDLYIYQEMEALPPVRRQLVTNHDSFRYYARRYGLLIPATLLGVSTGASDPSARAVVELVRGLRRWETPAVFAENTFNPALLRQVAREAGLPPPQTLYTGLSGPDGPIRDYLMLMRYNTAVISRALAEPSD